MAGETYAPTVIAALMQPGAPRVERAGPELPAEVNTAMFHC